MSETRWRILSVAKGDPSRPDEYRKSLDMATVMYFVSKMNGYPLHIGENWYMMLVPNRADPDIKWFLDEIFRYVDIQRVTNVSESPRTADRLVKLVEEKDPERTRYAGPGIIKAYAVQMYLKFEEWEPDALRFRADLRDNTRAHAVAEAQGIGPYPRRVRVGVRKAQVRLHGHPRG